MKILSTFQVINQDGQFIISFSYNETDEDGNIVKRNLRESFYAIEKNTKAHIQAIEDYIREVRLGGNE